MVRNLFVRCFEVFENIRQNHSGLLYGVICGFSTPTMKLFVKQMTQYCGAGQMLFLRYLFSLPIVLILIRSSNRVYTPALSEIKYVILRCVQDALSYLLCYVSFSYMPYLDSLVICFGCMVITSATVSRFWLSERVSAFTTIMLILIFAGIVVTCQPTMFFDFDIWKVEQHNLLMGSMFAMLGGALHGASASVNRKILITPALTIFLYICICGIITGLIEALATEDFNIQVNIHTIFLGLAVALSGILSQYSWCRGFQLAKTVDLALVLPIEIPVGMLLQYVVLGIAPNSMSIVGSVFITIAIFLTALVNKMFPDNSDYENTH